MSKKISKTKSADLILKLYDLRREPVMREARSWIVSFSPETAADVMRAVIEPETSAKFRMVTSYWNMAASFVHHGAIDEEMFNEAAGEHILIYSKLEPFIEEIRQMMGNPSFFKNLENLVMNMPDAKQMLASRREMMKKMMQMRADAAQSS
jgi:DNA primase large subunit